MLKFIKISLFVGLVVSFASCAANKPLVSYTVDGKIENVSVGEVVKDFSLLFDQIPPQDMENAISNPEFIERIIIGRIIESKVVPYEAEELSNYKEDPAYLTTVKQYEEFLPFQVAFDKGNEKIQDELQKQKVSVVELSRIMFTNKSNDPNTEDITVAEQVLADLQESEDLFTDFSLSAEKYSEEPLGMQTGGYIGHVVPSQYPSIDELLFDEKIEGLYPSVVVDEQGSYILYVHTKSRQISTEELENLGLASATADLGMEYIKDSISYLYTIENDGILLNKKPIDLEKFKDTTKIIKLWGKSYSVKDILPAIDFISGGALGEIDTESLLKALYATDEQPSLIAVQLAVIYKSYNSSLLNSKEYKEILAEQMESIKLETIYNIVSTEYFSNMTTNVTPEELATYYSDTNNRIATTVDKNNNPVYLSLAESKDFLTEAIIRARSMSIQDNFRQKLVEKYNIEWKGENMELFLTRLQKAYEKYTLKNEG